MSSVFPGRRGRNDISELTVHSLVLEGHSDVHHPLTPKSFGDHNKYNTVRYNSIHFFILERREKR